MAAPSELYTALNCLRASADWLVFNKIDKKDSKIDFEMSLIVVEAIRGRCVNYMILTTTVSEILVERQVNLF